MFSIIVAFDKKNLIGKLNRLPWRIKEDLLNFKRLTLNHTVVMGRKTFESIGKPLPKRKNIVLTRDFEFKSPQVEVCNDLKKLLDFENSSDEVFIIGGSEVYKKLLNRANRLYISHIKGDYTGDTYFPTINYNEWSVIETKEFDEFTFKVYERKFKIVNKGE